MGRWQGTDSPFERSGLAHIDFRSVKDCELFCRVVFGEQDDAYKNVPLPFRPVELSGKLKFGYYFSGKLLRTYCMQHHFNFRWKRCNAAIFSCERQSCAGDDQRLEIAGT